MTPAPQLLTSAASLPTICACNLVECVLPEVPLRQWVFTFPFPWPKRLAYDGALLGVVTRTAVS